MQQLFIGKINEINYDCGSKITASGISLKIFQTCFLKDTLYGSPKNIQIDEISSYKGGRTEVF